MAKRVAQALVGILALLLCLVVYYIQANNNKMLMLSAKLVALTFVVFLFSAFFYYAAERRRLIVKIANIAGGLSLAYLALSAVDYIVRYSASIEKTAAIANGTTFFGWAFPIICLLGGLGALLYGLSPGTRHNRRKKEGEMI